MANPNIVNVTEIYGENSLVALSTTSMTQVLSNAASSGKVYKVNSIVVANSQGSLSASITISIFSQAALGGTAYPVAYTILVPADTSIILVDKSTGIYIKEDQSIGAQATSANVLTVVASWEEIT